MKSSHENINKIKPALRTKGNVTGNFGKQKPKAGSPLNDINGNYDPGSLPTKLEYFHRLLNAYPQLPHNVKPGIYKQLRQLGATLNLLPLVKAL